MANEPTVEASLHVQLEANAEIGDRALIDFETLEDRASRLLDSALASSDAPTMSEALRTRLQRGVRFNRQDAVFEVFVEADAATAELAVTPTCTHGAHGVHEDVHVFARASVNRRTGEAVVEVFPEAWDAVAFAPNPEP